MLIYSNSKTLKKEKSETSARLKQTSDKRKIDNFFNDNKSRINHGYAFTELIREFILCSDIDYFNAIEYITNHYGFSI